MFNEIVIDRRSLGWRRSPAEAISSSTEAPAEDVETGHTRERTESAGPAGSTGARSSDRLSTARDSGNSRADTSALALESAEPVSTLTYIASSYLSKLKCDVLVCAAGTLAFLAPSERMQGMHDQV